VGANMNDVVKALKLDKRVSQFAPINPGLGFAGGTLGRDIQSVKMIGKKYRYAPTLLNAVTSVNKDRIPQLLRTIKKVYPTIKNKKIGILGLTYKPNTSTLRRSMALQLASLLHAKGALVHAYDPAISKKIKEAPYIRIATSLEAFAQNVDMIILMTDWKEFKDINPSKLAESMNHCVIIDTKNFLDQHAYKNSGFTYIGIGI
jgi:UDPglucose 6-dehydrogenase